MPDFFMAYYLRDSKAEKIINEIANEYKLAKLYKV